MPLFTNWFRSNRSNELQETIQSGAAGGGGWTQSGAALGSQQSEAIQSEAVLQSARQLASLSTLAGLSQQINNSYQSRYYYTPSAYDELFNTIGSMACSVGANITKITVDRSTYARIMSDLGSVQRSMNSDTLTINTAMGPIQIDWRDNDSKTSNIDLSAYMEDV